MMAKNAEISGVPYEQWKLEHMSRKELLAEITRLREELANGSAELRRSVEANGFEWQGSESAVWHAVTAIGLFRGTIDALREETERLRRRLAIAEAAMARAVNRWQCGQSEFADRIIRDALAEMEAVK